MTVIFNEILREKENRQAPEKQKEARTFPDFASIPPQANGKRNEKKTPQHEIHWKVGKRIKDTLWKLSNVIVDKLARSHGMIVLGEQYMRPGHRVFTGPKNEPRASDAEKQQSAR